MLSKPLQYKQTLGEGCPIHSSSALKSFEI